MKALHASALVILLVFVWLALSGLESNKARITVESGYYHTDPATVRLRVRVEPDAENRFVFVEAVSAGFSRASAEPLDGIKAPPTYWFEWKGIPAGDYAVIATVERGRSRAWQAQAAFVVLD